jgi:hypothetical protein
VRESSSSLDLHFMTASSVPLLFIGRYSKQQGMLEVVRYTLMPGRRFGRLDDCTTIRGWKGCVPDLFGLWLALFGLDRIRLDLSF